MRINIFEGARRIALLFAVLVTVGVLIAAGLHEPYLTLRYSVERPDAPLVRMTDESCPLDAASNYFSHDVGEDRSVGITLCLLPMAFGQNRDQQLIPYRIDNGMIHGAPSYSPEVSEYERRWEEEFQLPAGDADWVGEELRRLYLQNWKDVIKYLFIGLAIFWAMVWAIGWIVRGFAGIPMHRDARIKGEAD